MHTKLHHYTAPIGFICQLAFWVFLKLYCSACDIDKLLLMLSGKCYSISSTQLCPVLVGDREKLAGLDLLKQK